MIKRSIVAASVRFVHTVVPALLKTLRTLWHEVIGFLFLALGVWAMPSAFRLYRNFNGDAESFFKLVIISVFIAIMVGYGISSYLRARRISRS